MCITCCNRHVICIDRLCSDPIVFVTSRIKSRKALFIHLVVLEVICGTLLLMATVIRLALFTIDELPKRHTYLGMTLKARNGSPAWFRRIWHYFIMTRHGLGYIELSVFSDCMQLALIRIHLC
jgi:hypothetical protein